MARFLISCAIRASFPTFYNRVLPLLESQRGPGLQENAFLETRKVMGEGVVPLESSFSYSQVISKNQIFWWL